MKKIFYLMIMAVMAGAFASCSKDDEPEGYEPTYDGVAIYINAVEQLYNNEGDPRFVETGTDGLYVVIADNREIAYKFIANILENENWDGGDVTVSLGDKGENGNLKIISRNLPDGIYDEIVVDIKDYTPYTLQIVTEERFNNENSEGYSGGGVARLQNQ